MSDFSDNIKRIADTEGLQKLIEQLLDEASVNAKKPIKGDRSVAYETAGGGVAQQSGTPGETTTQDTGSTETTPNNGDDGGNDDGTGDDGDGKDSSKDEHDLEDILNNGLNIGDKVGVLSGLTNCAGKNGIIYMDGAFRPYDWGDIFDDYGAEEDPRNDQWVEGTWYQYAGVAATNAANPYSSVEAYLPTWDSLDPGNAPHAVAGIDTYDPASDSTVEVTVSRASGTFDVNVTIFTSGCTIGVDSYCPSEQPEEPWPSDDMHQLTFDGGQFETSVFENLTDNVGPWGQPSAGSGPSSISGCTSSGETVTISATGNGRSEVSFGNGDVYELDSTNTVVGIP